MCPLKEERWHLCLRWHFWRWSLISTPFFISGFIPDEIIIHVSSKKFLPRVIIHHYLPLYFLWSHCMWSISKLCVLVPHSGMLLPHPSGLWCCLDAKQMVNGLYLYLPGSRVLVWHLNSAEVMVVWTRQVRGRVGRGLCYEKQEFFRLEDEVSAFLQSSSQ